MAYISDEIERLTGFPPGAFIDSQDRPFVSVIHPEDRDVVAAAVAGAVAAGRPFFPEYRIVRADESVVWVLERGQVVTGDDGEVWVDGVIFDITDRKVLEDELHRSLAREAAAEERSKLAGELHDVVGHALTVAAIQAGVGRAVLPDGAEAADRALALIEDTVRGAMAEMRRMVQALRAVPDAGTVVGVSRLEALIHQVQQAGLDVELEAPPVREVLPAAVDVSLYRIAQESLTNCLKHAPGSKVRVSLGYERSAAVTLRVVDDGAACTVPELFGDDSSGGDGLRSMQARALALGGTLDAGPVASGGFAVTARFPLPDSA